MNAFWPKEKVITLKLDKRGWTGDRIEDKDLLRKFGIPYRFSDKDYEGYLDRISKAGYCFSWEI